jgi:assimilatory nitrate reductase catalytic subunit
MIAPVPKLVRTHCPYCAFQCGMTIGADAAIAPDAGFPVNRGQMCIKGFTSGELLAHPKRLLEPLVRGVDGELHPASWDDALDFVAEKLRSIRGAHGSEAVAAFGSGSLTNEKAYALGKFVRVVLRSPNVDYNGRYCMSSAAAGQNAAFGVDRGLPFPVADIAQSKCVLLWGSNCADTMPPIMQWFDAQRENGGSLIVADPRLTETARAAQLHLQLTPGSDLALANGLLYLAIDLKLIDRDYIVERTSGFDAVRAVVQQYFPARVERLAGVSVDKMRRAVELLATSRSSMLLSGRGPEQQSKGTDTVLSFANLMLALGRVGKPFSGYGCITGQGNGQGGREHGQKADQLPGYRLIESREDRAQVAAAWGVDVDALPGKGKSAVELLDSCGQPDGVRGLLVFGSNVVVATPDASRVDRRLAGLDLLVVCDSFLNETCAHAHVVLPTLQWAEEEGTMTNLEGRVIHRRKAIDAPDGPRGDLTILLDLAGRLGCPSFLPSSETRAVFDEFARVTSGGRADYGGITYDKIDAQDGVFWPCPDADHPGTPRLFADRFFHADGKARFVPVEHRRAGEEPDADYPLYFTTGRYREHYNSGAQTRLVRPLVEARQEPKLQIHPMTADRHGVTDGGLVTVQSRRGRVEFTASVSDEIRPDTLFVPFHWGGRHAANVLTNPALDPKSRMPEFKVCAVRIVVRPTADEPTV